MMEQDTQFLEYVIKALVEHPNDVKLARTVDEMGVFMTLSVNPEDMGKVIASVMGQVKGKADGQRVSATEAGGGKAGGAK